MSRRGWLTAGGVSVAKRTAAALGLSTVLVAGYVQLYWGNRGLGEQPILSPFVFHIGVFGLLGVVQLARLARTSDWRRRGAVIGETLGFALAVVGLGPSEMCRPRLSGCETVLRPSILVFVGGMTVLVTTIYYDLYMAHHSSSSRGLAENHHSN